MLSTALPLIAILLAAPGGKKLEQGQKLFNQGDFDGALKSLDAAAVEAGDAATLEKVHLLRAQCLAARQDFVKAEDAFALALDANPDAQLDPTRVDPTLVKLLDSVRSRLVGAVSLNSSPTGASLVIDGKPSGVTPQSVSLPAGRHKLEVKWGEGAGESIEVQVKPKRDLRVDWVQQKTEVKTIELGLTPRPVRPFGDLRGAFEPASSGAVDAGLELGGGIEVIWFRIGLYARFFPHFNVTPRFAFSLPVVSTPSGDFNVALEVGVPLSFLVDGFGIGVGGSGGLEWYPLKWFGAYVMVGGRHHFLWPGRNDLTAFTAIGGVRLRLP
jgi:hypothetical protein